MSVLNFDPDVSLSNDVNIEKINGQEVNAVTNKLRYYSPPTLTLLLECSIEAGGGTRSDGPSFGHS